MDAVSSLIPLVAGTSTGLQRGLFSVFLGYLLLTNQTIIENGRDLLEAKNTLPKEESFIKWSEGALGLRKERAYEYIRIAEAFGNSADSALDNLQKSSLILLSSPSIPDEAREEATERAETGEEITHQKAKEPKESLKTIAELEYRLAPDLNKLISDLNEFFQKGKITKLIKG